jgi:hypothetical protein
MERFIVGVVQVFGWKRCRIGKIEFGHYGTST